MQNYDERVKKIREYVESSFVRNAHRTVFIEDLSNEDREHIIQIGVSILLTKTGLGPPGGSFVQAICANDLVEAHGRADFINMRVISFYCLLTYNYSA